MARAAGKILLRSRGAGKTTQSSCPKALVTASKELAPNLRIRPPHSLPVQYATYKSVPLRQDSPLLVQWQSCVDTAYASNRRLVPLSHRRIRPCGSL